MSNNTKYHFIDLFAGCGGLSLGFENAGFKGLLAIDCWQDALDTYAKNRKGAKTLCADISALNPLQVKEDCDIADVDVIIGGPPCQGFSVAGKRIVEDKRNELYKSFVRFVDVFRPKAFVMENVPNILSLGGGIVRDAILKDFEQLGYTVTYKVLTAADYGVPQNRRRAIFVGLKDGKAFDFPHPTVENRVTSKEALSDLPEGTLSEGCAYVCEPQSDYQRIIRDGSSAVYNHETTIHNEQTQRIISMVPDGGNYKDLPIELQNTRKVHIAWTRLNSRRPSFTIDCGHRHHFHYEYNRVTTGQRPPREVAEIILANRKEKIKYYNKNDPQVFNLKGKPRSKGDVTRYAGDILDYMEIASLVENHDNYFYLAPNQSESIRTIASDDSFFDGYEHLYGVRNLTTQQISSVEVNWFKYVNNNLDSNKFKTDISTIFEKDQEITIIVDDRIREVIASENTTTKDVGNIGETLIHGHEVTRLRIAGYPDLAKLVQIVDSPSYHPGFDIDSFEGDTDGIHRYIEVKTTISRQRIKMYNFHMSPNEWSVARTHREHYCVYRLMLSMYDKTLYILRDPVGLDREDKITAMPRNGMEISFDASIFEPTELLTPAI